MSALYEVDVRTINDHIQKIYDDGELTKEATIRNFRIVQTEGNRQVQRDVLHYNLQLIISVGFKVNNERAVRFRKWAGQIVKDYTIQGWTMDPERLKKGHKFTEDFFERQLQQIREIRLTKYLGETMATQGQAKEKTKNMIKEPRQFNVIMYNDDFTTMEFVVEVLVDIFHKDEVTAQSIMMNVHKKGQAVVGRYPFDIASTKVNAALMRAKQEGFPFRMSVEEA